MSPLGKIVTGIAMVATAPLAAPVLATLAGPVLLTGASEILVASTVARATGLTETVVSTSGSIAKGVYEAGK